MTTAEITTGGLSETEHRAHLRRAMIASTVGTTIEWYDFLLDGQMAALVFAKLYFPSSDAGAFVSAINGHVSPRDNIIQRTL